MNMPFPNISNISTEIKINKDKSLNLLLAAIAFEQLGLSRIINAEVEKLQYILDIFENNHQQEILTVREIIQINTITRKIFRTVINNHILLQFKLEDVLDMVTAKITTSTVIDDTTLTTSATSASYSPTMSCEVPINKVLSVLSAPLLHNNVNVNRNIVINDNRTLLSRNSNVINITKAGSSVNSKTAPHLTL